MLGQAVAGHHGRPPAADEAMRDKQRRAVGPVAEAAAADAIAALVALFAPMSLDGMSDAEAARLSWLVSGLTVQADWLGSNSDWFPFASPDREARDYCEGARERASTAVDQAGLGRAMAALIPGSSQNLSQNVR